MWAATLKTGLKTKRIRSRDLKKENVHKRYEFGGKVGLVSTSKGNWIVGTKAFPDNPYDGHIVQKALEQIERLMKDAPEMACCDLGYRK